MPPRPPSNRGERTVLTYVKLDFQGDWEYFFDTYSFRPAGEKAILLVVTEAPTGSLVTHTFIVRRRAELPPGQFRTTDHVIVPREENIVYIPERCSKREDGDRTVCIKPNFIEPIRVTPVPPRVRVRVKR